MKVELPNEKKMIAIIIVVLLMIATLYIAIVSIELGDVISGGPGEEEFLIIPGKNYAVTATPEPNNEPGMAVDPNDPMHIVAASNDYGTPNGDAWVGYYVSWDGGKTWTRDLIPGYLGGPISPLTGMDLSGDPVVCFDAQGNVFISGLFAKRARNPVNPLGFGFNAGRADGIFVAKSTDGGATFDQISILATAMQTMISFHDKEWMAVDMNNGNVYVVWVVFTILSVANVLFSRSTDNGNSFSTPQVISEYSAFEIANQGSTIQVTPDGRVHVWWIDFNQAQVRYTFSDDQGGTFSQPRSIADVVEIPRYVDGNDYRTPTLLMSAADPNDENGSLYVTWNDYRTGDSDALLIFSHDNGATWSDQLRMNDDEEGNGLDQYFPAVAVSPDGFVHVFFYDKRNDENNTIMEVYYTMSMDGGMNWTFNINASDASFNGNNAPHAFIGDYNAAAASEHTAYYAWCDTREGTPETGDSEIYFVAVKFGCPDCFEEDNTE